MTTATASAPVLASAGRVRHATPYRHLAVVRAAAGVPLLAIGLAHVFAPEAPMRPLVEAAGFPLPGIVAPLGVAIEVGAGLALLLGWWARVAAVLAAPVMLGAIYAHLVIDVWPNGAANEPPLALPIAVLAGALYVAWRGAGSWSLDRRARTRGQAHAEI